jgi:L,D-peptidoglycan transpeptidase YkuD (ErfK/YbiS/YcfS/YnhG family)
MALAAATVAVATLQLPASASRPLATSRAAACGSSLPTELATVDGARQLVTVVAPTGSATVAVLTGWQRDGACWRIALGPWIGRVGVHGVRLHKREGDGATPLGIFELYSTVYGTAPNPGVHLRYRRLRCGDWWDEDVSSPAYNSFQQVGCGVTPPFANGVSEPLWLSPTAYASFAVIGYNTGRVPGLGSAIFLHASVGLATTGCVVLRRDLLDRVLDWLEPALRPHVAIGTRATIGSL